MGINGCGYHLYRLLDENGSHIDEVSENHWLL